MNILIQVNLSPVVRWPAADLQVFPPAQWRWVSPVVSPASSPTWSDIWEQRRRHLAQSQSWTQAGRQHTGWPPSIQKLNVWFVFICYLIFNMQPFFIWPRLNLILSWCWVWRQWDHAAALMSLTSCQQSCPCGKTRVFPQSFHCGAVSHCVKECSNRAPWMFNLCTTTCYWSGLAGERFMSCFHIFGLCKYI